MDHGLKIEVYSLLPLIKGKLFPHSYRTNITVLNMLVNADVNSFFIEVKFAFKVMGRNTSISTCNYINCAMQSFGITVLTLLGYGRSDNVCCSSQKFVEKLFRAVSPKQ